MSRSIVNSPQLVCDLGGRVLALGEHLLRLFELLLLGRRLGDLLAVTRRGGARFVVVTAARGDEHADAGDDQERDHEDQGGAVPTLHRR